jgi:hypothetical protein
MRMSQVLIAATMAASTLALPALAEEMQMKPGTMMMIEPDGRTTTTPMDNSKMSMEAMGMMDKSAAMKGPMLLMMGSDGKMHMMDNAKMSDGMAMSDTMKKK